MGRRGQDGEREPPRPGTVQAALRHRDFRTVWSGQTVSQIGSWMQNVAVGPYALSLSKDALHPHGSASFVALVYLAQQAPQLVLSIVGGVLGTRYPRKRLIIAGQAVQTIAALMLSLLAFTHPSKLGLVLCVLTSGIAGALSMPAYQSLTPELVGYEDLPGAISLGSATMNGSRVVGPVILLAMAALGVRTGTKSGVSIVFLVNALTFFASMAAIASVDVKPLPPRSATDSRGAAQLLDGFREARRNPVVGRSLSILFFLSLLCLPYIAQFPSIAERNLGFDANATTYKVMYGMWAFGAMVGSLAQATLLVDVDKRKSVRWYLVGFGLSLLAFAGARSAWTAFPVVVVLGFFYFASTTALSTVLQQHLRRERRAPVMALWMMAFGGTIPFGSTWGGKVIDRWSPTPMLVIGGVSAFALATAATFVTLARRTPAVVSTGADAY